MTRTDLHPLDYVPLAVVVIIIALIVVLIVRGRRRDAQ
jgi:hypothetical protein